MSRVVFLTVLLSWPLLAAFEVAVAAEDSDPSVPIAIDAAEARLNAKLDEPTNFDFEETPLDEVAEYLRDLHGIQILIDHTAVEEFGVGTDTPVTIRVREVSLRSGLRHLLRGIDPALVYTVTDEVLMITTAAAATPEFRLYNIRPLLKANNSAERLARTVAFAVGIPLGRATAEDAKDIAERKVGIPAAGDNTTAIAYYDQLLVVRGPSQLQYKVQQFLRGLTAALSDQPRTSRVEHDLQRRESALQAQIKKLEGELRNRRQPTPFTGEDDEGDDPFGGDAEPFGGGKDEVDPFG